MAKKLRVNGGAELVSMTAFGRGVSIVRRERVEIEIRGVNSRTLDLTMRGVDLGAVQDFALREELSARITRGRVDISVVRSSAAQAQRDDFDVSRLPRVVEVLRKTSRSIEKEYRALFMSYGLASLLARGDLFPLVRTLPAESPDFGKAVSEAFTRALDSFVQMRCREGARLQRAIEKLLKDITRCKVKIALRARSAKSRAEKRVRARMKVAAGPERIDSQRLSQEVSLLLDRSDIAEELERIGSHVHECDSILKKGSAGKRLEFLAQELQREFNTIGSKAQDSTIQNSVVDAKVAIERMREQVQNVE